MTKAPRIRTCAEAIAMGLLIDVTCAAKQVGIHFQTAITARVWKRCVVMVAGHSKKRQAEWVETLVRFLSYALAQFASRHAFSFQTLVLHSKGGIQPVWLRAVRGTSNAGEPVIVLMMPEEGEEITNRHESSTEESGHE